VSRTCGQYEGTEITTIEGLPKTGRWHPMQAAFRRTRRLPVRVLYARADLFGGRDGSGIRKGSASAVTNDVSASAADFPTKEIKNG